MMPNEWEENTQTTSAVSREGQRLGTSGQQTCLLVLGMHRSGTSALTRLLSIAGASLPERVLGKGEGNDAGHWEPEALNRFHDRLLSEVGSCWHDWTGPEFSRLSPKRLESAGQELLDILDQEYAAKDLFVLKDPRICRFTPFFISTLASAGIRTLPILAFRSPTDVIRSLEARRSLWPPQYSSADGAMLWLRHILDAEQGTRGMPRAFLSYDAVLSDWRGSLQKVMEQTGLEFPKTLDEIAPEVEGFLSIKHRHEHSAKQALLQDPVTRVWIASAYEATEELERTPESPRALKQLDEISNKLNEALPILVAVSENRQRYVVHATELTHRVAMIEQRAAELEEQAVHLKSHIVAQIQGHGIERRIDLIQSELEEKAKHLYRRMLKQEAERKQVNEGLKWKLEQAQSELEETRRLRRILKIASPLKVVASAPKRAVDGTFALATAIKRRGGVVPTIKKTAHILRNYGLSGVTHRLRTMAQFRQRQIAALPALKSKPFVSVIVPNYNHAAFLERRLDTILAQTYQNFELIMLDDCSSDGSIEILRRFAREHPLMARLVANTENSGSGYRQWAKGLSMAKGELVWIAESDDWSEPDFLESLISSFDDESVMMAYTNSAFTDSEGDTAIWSTPEYLSDLDPVLWNAPFQLTAHQLVRKGWATKNLVPNVSSAVFRHPGRTCELLRGSWTEMKICGDWLFYLNLINGGTVAYRNEMRNYYRIHQASTAKSTFVKDVYYREHEDIAKYVLENYNVTPDFMHEQQNNLRQHWQSNRDDYSDEKLLSCYDPARLKGNLAERKPSILMAGFAFSAGGGETFPIFLANLLKARGYAVTFLSCEMEPREKGVRNLLRPDIPIVTDCTRLATIIDEFAIDIVHSHHGWVDNIILDQLPETARVRTIISMHGMYEMMEPIDQDVLAPRILERSSALVFTSDKNLAPFKRLGLADDPKLVGIRNALPEVQMHPVDRATLGIPDEAFLACLVSRAIPEKGWNEAIKSVERARSQSGKDIRLLLIGEGEEYDRLREPNADLEFVKFLGFKRNLRDYFATADLGFLPSRFKGESAPLTLIDCLAAGTPFLGSNVGEIRHMLGAGDKLAGDVFDLDNWRLPIDKMAAILARAAERDGYYNEMVAAVPMAYEKFDPEFMLDRYIDIYHRVVRGEHASGPMVTSDGSVGVAGH